MPAQQPSRSAATLRHWKTAVPSLVLLAGLWLVLSGGAMGSWVVGLPALALAGWAARRLGKPRPMRLSVMGLVRFLPFFLWESLRGGIDVALRTLQPSMPIQPDFIHYRSQLQTSAARTFLANCVSLLPGTLAADLQGEWLEIHVLNSNSDQIEGLTRLEQAIGAIFTEEEKQS